MNGLSLTIAALLLAGALAAHSAGPDDEYLSIYYLIQQGDAAADNNQKPEAAALYGEAQTNLLRMRAVYPSWQTNVVEYRLKYLAKKIGDLDYTPPAPPVTNAVKAADAAVQAQIDALQAQVQLLQSNNTSLQAKLREALSARPALEDPAELTRAEAQIQELARQNELLKVSLKDTEAKASATASAKQIADLRKELEATNTKLAAEMEQSRKLARERGDLANRLNKVVGSPRGMNGDSVTSSELAVMEQRMTTQQALTAQLQRERTDLLARWKALETEAANAAALRAENEVLRRQVAELKAATPVVTTDPSSLGPRLAAAEAQIAALRSERDLLKLERAALENRVVQLASAKGFPLDSARRIQQLELQVEELEKQLVTANRQLVDGKSAETADSLAAQLAAARAALEVFNAKSVPYSPTELELFRQAPAQLATTDTTPRQSSAIPKPPAGSAALVAEAQRYFARGDFAKAEERYQQVLTKDDKNAYTLANLAAIQLEQGKLDDAEKNLRRALTASPDDAYSLQTLGYLKFRQKNYDEAFTQLSHAAQIDPGNAEIQNYLGVTLSHKGQRAAAETALRKALQLEPGYASAHNNLAVIYATQSPPAVALARWHYQKALAGGQPKNAQLETLFQQKETQATP
jgi:Flp pilus assembly protein TadD